MTTFDSDWDDYDIEYGMDDEEPVKVCAPEYTPPAMEEQKKEKMPDSDDEEDVSTWLPSELRSDLSDRLYTDRLIAQIEREEARDTEVQRAIEERKKSMVGIEKFKNADQTALRALIKESRVGLINGVPRESEMYMVASKKQYADTIATHVIRQVEKIGKRGSLTYMHCATFDLAVKHAESGTERARDTNPVCMHEVVLGRYPFKAVLDVDIKKSSDQFTAASKMAACERKAVHDVIAEILIAQFVRVSFDMVGARKTALPYVVWANRDDKLSFHIIAHDEGMICRNNKQAVKFIEQVKTNLLDASSRGSNPLCRYVCKILGESDDFLDIGLVKKKVFSLRLPLYDKVADGTYEHKKNSKLLPYKQQYTPAKYSSYFLQHVDVVWNANGMSPPVSNLGKIQGNVLEDLIQEILNTYEEYELGKTTPDGIVVASFTRKIIHVNGKRTAMMTACKCAKPHMDKDAEGKPVRVRVHENAGAILVRTMKKSHDHYTLYCMAGGVQRKLWEKTLGFSDNSDTSIFTYEPHTVHDSKRYIHGEGCMIETIPSMMDMTYDVYISSAYGTGKTQHVRAVSKAVKEENGRMLVISARKSLSAKYAQDIGAVSYRNVQKKFDMAKDRVIVCQFESLHKIPKDMRFDVTVIDEPAALISHIESNSVRVGSSGVSKGFAHVRPDNTSNQKRLINILQPTRTGALMVYDNDMCDDIIDAFVSIRKNEDGTPLPMKIYVNDYKPYTHVNAVIDAKKGHEERLYGKVDQFIAENLPLCQTKEHNGLVITCHCKSKCKELFEHVKSRVGKGHEHLIRMYTADTDDDVREKDFGDVNAAWADSLVVIYNQTVSVGVSFDGAHFSHVYGLFGGMWDQINAVQTVQSLFRCRQPKEMYLAITKPGFEYARCGKLVTTKSQLAREVEQLAHFATSSVYEGCYITPPGFIHGQIVSATTESESREEAVEAITEILGKGFINLAWVYHEIVQGRTMADPVQYVDFLLRKSGIKPTHIEDSSFGETKEAIAKYYNELKVQGKQRADHMKEIKAKEFADRVNEVAALIEYDYSDTAILYESPNLAEHMELLVDPTKKKRAVDERADLDDLYGDSVREDKVRTYKENERTRIEIYYTWKHLQMTNGTNIRDITLQDVKEARSWHAISDARRMMHMSAKYDMDEIVRDPRIIAVEYCRTLLFGIWGYTEANLRDHAQIRIPIETLKSGKAYDTIVGMSHNVDRLTGSRFRTKRSVKDGAATYEGVELDMTCTRTLTLVLNAYLKLVGMEVTHVKVGRAKVPHYQIHCIEDEAYGDFVETHRSVLN